jgi:hypothetical protein
MYIINTNPLYSKLFRDDFKELVLFAKRYLILNTIWLNNDKIGLTVLH